MSQKTVDLFFGPQHPGITGNFSVRVTIDGDTVVKAQVIPGFLHRGFEKLMEMRHWIQGPALICRVCVPDPDHSETAYATAVERLADIEVPERGKYIRALTLEMSRLSAYLFYFGGYAGSIGLYTMGQWAVGDRDYLLDLYEQLTGARVYHIFNFPGGPRWDTPPGFEDKVDKLMDYYEKRLKEYDKLYFNNKVFLKRAQGTAVMTKSYAQKMEVTGPNARSTGWAIDVRKDDPYAAYPDLDFDIITQKEGDNYARIMQRRLEFEQSMDLIRQITKKLRNMPRGDIRVTPNPLQWKIPPGEAYGAVESSKGELGYYVVSDGGISPYRMQVRGPSISHGVQVYEEMVVGQRLADVAALMFSLDVCPPDIDR